MPRHTIYLSTPEPTPCTHSCPPHSPTPIYTQTAPCDFCCTRSQPPHMIIACLHPCRYLYLSMPRHGPYTLHTPKQTPCTTHASHTGKPTPTQPPAIPVPFLPHSITVHMHDHHMPTPIAMPLPINALIVEPYTLRTPGPTRCTHMRLSHTHTPVHTQALSCP